MSRSLEEMKLARGGKCLECGINIMDPIHKDHSFCNDCWIKLLSHPYSLEDGGCAFCGEPEDSPLHIKSQPEEDPFGSDRPLLDSLLDNLT